MKRELTFLKSHLQKNETIVLAVSGGPDSMCLYSLVNSLKAEYNLTIIVAHVNHKLRKEADSEEAMVRKIVKYDQNIFEVLTINEYLKQQFSENDARKRRYKFFEEVVNKYQATSLLTAHHGDDLIETILMRLTRGSNLSGYIGIRAISKNDHYRILRPLLTSSKEDILNYLKQARIEYAIDKSNDDLKYTRNRYRHFIIPFLHKEIKDVQLKYLNFSSELEAYDIFVNNYIVKNKYIVDNWLDINKVKNEDEFIKRKCIELIVKKIQEKDYFDISNNQVKQLLNLMNQSNKTVDLNNGYKGINSYGKLTIQKSKLEIFEEIEINGDIEINNFKFYYNSKEADNTNGCICLSSLEVALPLKLRPKKDGDKMVVKNLNGSKKISDIFINSKLAKEKREAYPILVDNNNEILWVPNIKKSKFAKDKLEKYDIIIKCEAR